MNSEQTQIPIQEESSGWLQFGSEQAASLYSAVINVAWEKNEGNHNARLDNREPQQDPRLQSHHRPQSQDPSRQHHESDMSRGQSENDDEGEGNEDADSPHNHVQRQGISDDDNGTKDDKHNEEEEDEEGEEKEREEEEEEEDHPEGNSNHSNATDSENNGSKIGVDQHENSVGNSSLHTREESQGQIGEEHGEADEDEHNSVPTGGAQRHVSIQRDGQSSEHTLEGNKNDEYHDSEYHELRGDTTLGDRHADETHDTTVFDNSIYNQGNSQSSANLHSSSSHASEDWHGNSASISSQDDRYHDHASFGSLGGRIPQNQLRRDTHREYTKGELPSGLFHNRVQNTEQSIITNVNEARLGEEPYHIQRDSVPSSDAQQWTPFIQPKENQNELSGRQRGFADDPQVLSRSSSDSPGRGHSDEIYLSSSRHAREIRERSWDAPHQPITDPEYNITTQDLRTAFRLLPINQTLVESGLLPLLTSYDIRNDTEFKELALHGNLTDMYVRYGSLLRRGHGSILGPPYNKPVDNIYHVRHSTNPKKGYSMYASENIPAETILGSYGGELVLSSRLQHGQYAWEAPSMFLRTESGVWKEHATTLDSSRVGNLLRFVNDLGDDTYNLEPIWVPLQNRWTLFYKTSRPIQAGEEFSIYYGPDYWGGENSSLNSRRRMAVARERVSPTRISDSFIQTELRMRSHEKGQALPSRRNGDEVPTLLTVDTSGQRNPSSDNGAVIRTTQEHEERLSPTRNEHRSNWYSERLLQPLKDHR